MVECRGGKECLVTPLRRNEYFLPEGVAEVDKHVHRWNGKNVESQRGTAEWDARR